MSLAVTHSRALDGLAAPEVTVEVHLANGLPSFTLVGLADTEVKEARERVRAAIVNSGLDFPHNKRITVNLAPADLPKESGRFDLPIALGILAASGQIDALLLSRFEFAGELSLAGDLRPVRGSLAMGLALRRLGSKRALVLPQASAQEAALVDGLAIHSAAHLLDVVKALTPGDAAQPLPRATTALAAAAPRGLDLSEVKGQTGAKRALEIAAAGGHSVLMVGPPGTGKSMLAQRFNGLLPPLSETQALESAAVLSLTGLGTVADPGFDNPNNPNGASAETFTYPDGGTTPFKGGKLSTWEGGMRAPAVIRWPGHIKPGTVLNDIFSSLDWLPTFVEIAGGPKGDGLKKQIEAGQAPVGGLVSGSAKNLATICGTSGEVMRL